MHLLVLSAFRLKLATGRGQATRSQCTFWCSVLSDRNDHCVEESPPCLNAPFGAQCFPTEQRHKQTVPVYLGLNAPFGAQCFPTAAKRMHLNTPFRMSQCTFWCSVLSDCRPFRLRRRRRRKSQCTFWCSVLSDAQQLNGRQSRARSQCTFWCSVLSDETIENVPFSPQQSQCTFWCSVLSD